MINFFRKVRQKLLKENKISSYLLYAIGEIVLVVIGILIALQINNWNEHNKTRKKEKVYLSNIKLDQYKNLESLSEFIEIRKEDAKSAEIVLSYFKNDSINLNDFNFHNLGVLEWYPFIQNNNTYEELINAGNLSLISNKEIKNEIQDLQANYKNVDFIETEMQQDYERYLYEVYFNTVDLDLSLKNLEEQLSNGNNQSSVKLDRKDVEILKQSTLYKNGLTLSKYNSNNLIREYQNIIDHTNQMIDHIDNDLQKQ